MDVYTDEQQYRLKYIQYDDLIKFQLTKEEIDKLVSQKLIYILENNEVKISNTSVMMVLPMQQLLGHRVMFNIFFAIAQAGKFGVPQQSLIKIIQPQQDGKQISQMCMILINMGLIVQCRLKTLFDTEILDYSVPYRDLAIYDYYSFQDLSNKQKDYRDLDQIISKTKLAINKQITEQERRMLIRSIGNILDETKSIGEIIEQADDQVQDTCSIEYLPNMNWSDMLIIQSTNYSDINSVIKQYTSYNKQIFEVSSQFKNRTQFILDEYKIQQQQIQQQKYKVEYSEQQLQLQKDMEFIYENQNIITESQAIRYFKIQYDTYTDNDTIRNKYLCNINYFTENTALLKERIMDQYNYQDIDDEKYFISNELIPAIDLLNILAKTFNQQQFSKNDVIKLLTLKLMYQMTYSTYKNLGWMCDDFIDKSFDQLPILIKMYLYSYVMERFMQKILTLLDKYMQYGFIIEVGNKYQFVQQLKYKLYQVSMDQYQKLFKQVNYYTYQDDEQTITLKIKFDDINYNFFIWAAFMKDFLIRYQKIKIAYLKPNNISEQQLYPYNSQLYNKILRIQKQFLISKGVDKYFNFEIGQKKDVKISEQINVKLFEQIYCKITQTQLTIDVKEFYPALYYQQNEKQQIQNVISTVQRLQQIHQLVNITLVDGNKTVYQTQSGINLIQNNKLMILKKQRIKSSKQIKEQQPQQLLLNYFDKYMIRGQTNYTQLGFGGINVQVIENQNYVQPDQDIINNNIKQYYEEISQQIQLAKSGKNSQEYQQEKVKYANINTYNFYYKSQLKQRNDQIAKLFTQTQQVCYLSDYLKDADFNDISIEKEEESVGDDGHYTEISVSQQLSMYDTAFQHKKMPLKPKIEQQMFQQQSKQDNNQIEMQLQKQHIFQQIEQKQIQYVNYNLFDIQLTDKIQTQYYWQQYAQNNIKDDIYQYIQFVARPVQIPELLLFLNITFGQLCFILNQYLMNQQVRVYKYENKNKEYIQQIQELKIQDSGIFYVSFY